jgi:glucose/arabinose dehydrogenase
MNRRAMIVSALAGVIAVGTTGCGATKAAMVPELTSADPTPAPRVQRKVNSADVRTANGYQLEAVATGLNFVTSITFGDGGEMYVAEAGPHTYGIDVMKAPAARILQILPDGSKKVLYEKNVSPLEIRMAQKLGDIPEGLIGPVTGVTWHDGMLYVTHRTRVSTLNPKNGEFKTIIDRLPAWGFFQNNRAIFGPDGKMYFFVSTQGNSGPIDEHWMIVLRSYNRADEHEVPCEDVTLTGQNFPTPVEDPQTASVSDKKLTGVYVPLGMATKAGQVIKGQLKCNGAFMRANPDGSALEMVAWGLRSVFGYNFTPDGRLIAVQNGGNPLAPREITFDWDTLWEVKPGQWYGWPDYFSGLPVTDPRFAPPYKPHKFVLTDDTHQRLLKGGAVPQPILKFDPPHVAAQSVVFGRPEFGLGPDEALIAEFGTVVVPLRDELPGFRVARVNVRTGERSDFLVNASGKPASASGAGGLERPIHLEFAPNGALYVADFGVIQLTPTKMQADPGTGVIWKVTHAQRTAGTPPAEGPEAASPSAP